MLLIAESIEWSTVPSSEQTDPSARPKTGFSPSVEQDGWAFPVFVLFEDIPILIENEISVHWPAQSRYRSIVVR